MSGNSLKAAITGNLEKQKMLDEAPKPVRTKTPLTKKTVKPKSNPARSNTVLIGGHFPPSIRKQLKLISAEDDTTIQALLEEALNLLFVKKGKGKIGEL